MVKCHDRPRRAFCDLQRPVDLEMESLFAENVQQQKRSSSPSKVEGDYDEGIARLRKPRLSSVGGIARTSPLDFRPSVARAASYERNRSLRIDREKVALHG